MKELLIPPGFAHGYLVIEDSIVAYKCAEHFYGEYDAGIIWNDVDINIQWPISLLDRTKVILSDKDKNLPSLVDYINRRMF